MLDVAEYLFIVCLCLLVVLICSPAKKIDIELDPTNPYVGILESSEINHKVPPDILYRLIESESSWDAKAVNKTKKEYSVGLAQINTKWLEYFREVYKINDPWGAEQAVQFAEDRLYDLYLLTGSWYEACLAYKCGLEGRKDAPGDIKAICRWVVEGGER